MLGQADTCSGPPPDLVDQWLLPITLVSSLVCCLVLVVDVILRLRPRPETTHARRRTASALSDYSIDDFEVGWSAIFCGLDTVI